MHISGKFWLISGMVQTATGGTESIWERQQATLVHGISGESDMLASGRQNACRYVRHLPSPRLIQELVQAWKTLRRHASPIGSVNELGISRTPSSSVVT